MVALYASQDRARDRYGAIVFQAVRDAVGMAAQTPLRYFAADCEDQEEAEAQYRLHVSRHEWQQRVDNPKPFDLDG